MPGVNPRPSSAGRWGGGGCTGSVELEVRYAKTTSPAAANGTRLHELAAAAVYGFDREVADADRQVIRPYVDDIVKEYHSRPGAELRIEKPAQWALNPELRGTPDAVLFDFQNMHLIIWDLKTGWRIIEALMNWQLLCYAAMLCPAKWTVELRIVQPLPYHREGPVRSWKLDWTQLMVLAVQIQEAFRTAIGAEPKSLVPGAHCLYCKALSGCPAARDVSLSALDYIGGETVDLPDDHIGRELRLLREVLEILKLRTAALEETASAKLRGGASLLGCSLAESRGGRTSWEGDPAGARFALKVLTGTDYAVAQLPTPTQLRNLGVSPELLKPLTKYQPGKMVVSVDTDREAQKVFGDKPNMEHTT